MNEIDNEYSVEDKRISYGLFHRKTKIKGKLFPEGKPKASDVRQGHTDLDCYMLAVFSSIAHKSPEKIMACFPEYYDEHGRERSNAPDFEKARDIKIRLFYRGLSDDFSFSWIGKKKIIKVNKTALRGKGVPWVRLLEKAFLVYRVNPYYSGKIKSRWIDGTHGSNTSIIEFAIKGGTYDVPVYIEFRDIRDTDNLFERIQSLLDKNKVVSAFKRHHVYSVLDAYEKTINGKKYKFIKVRNPYGGHIREYYQDKKGKWHNRIRLPKNIEEKGVSEVVWSEFVKDFKGIEFNSD